MHVTCTSRSWYHHIEIFFSATWCFPNGVIWYPKNRSVVIWLLRTWRMWLPLCWGSLARGGKEIQGGWFSDEVAWKSVLLDRNSFSEIPLVSSNYSCSALLSNIILIWSDRQGKDWLNWRFIRFVQRNELFFSLGNEYFRHTPKLLIWSEFCWVSNILFPPFFIHIEIKSTCLPPPRL